MGVFYDAFERYLTTVQWIEFVFKLNYDVLEIETVHNFFGNNDLLYFL